VAFGRRRPEQGFKGDLSAEDGDRTVLATGISIHCSVPQAIAFLRGTVDLACMGRLMALRRPSPAAA
jgi:hypothetical protein